MGPVTRALATPPPLIDRPPPIIPVRKTGRPWKMDGPAAITRTETLRVPRHDGRAIRKRRTEYNARSRIGAKMRCPKAFADRTAARDPDCQTAEIHIRIAPTNRVNAPGTALAVRMPRRQPGKGKSCPGHGSCNNAAQRAA
jgi:hypothetical protein